MGIYSFDFTAHTSQPPGGIERHSIEPQFRNLPDRMGRRIITHDKINVNVPEDIKTVLTRGFYVFDEGMKNWLSNIEIPLKDGFKKLDVRVPRGDKTVLVWQQDLREGRIRLPVASVHRGSATFNAEKFSPAYHRMRKRIVDTSGSRGALVYRPTPWLLEYQITVWTEWKQDAEYIMHQLLTRFSPLAEFRVADEHLQGTVILRFGSWSDASDIDSGKETIAKVRYEVSVTAEAWLPLPEKLVPLIRGKVSAMLEDSGEIVSLVGLTSATAPID